MRTLLDDIKEKEKIVIRILKNRDNNHVPLKMNYDLLSSKINDKEILGTIASRFPAKNLDYINWYNNPIDYDYWIKK